MFDFSGSQVKKFYQGVEQVPVGKVLTFAQLADVGFNVRQDRGLIYSANKYLLENHNKMLISQRKIGYKMAEPTEQMTHAWNRKGRARRQVTKAVLETTHIDTSKLTPDEKRILTDRELYLKQQLRALRGRNIAAQKVAKEAIVKVQKSVSIQEDVNTQIDKLIAEAEAIRRRLE